MPLKSETGSTRKGGSAVADPTAREFLRHRTAHGFLIVALDRPDVLLSGQGRNLMEAADIKRGGIISAGWIGQAMGQVASRAGHDLIQLP